MRRYLAALAPALAAAAGRTLRPVPDQGEVARVPVLDQVGEDRGRERGVVQPDLVVEPPALLGGLDPGRPSSTSPANSR